MIQVLIFIRFSLSFVFSLKKTQIVQQISWLVGQLDCLCVSLAASDSMDADASFAPVAVAIAAASAEKKELNLGCKR